MSVTEAPLRELMGSGDGVDFASLERPSLFYFLVWGHGLRYEEDIIALIRESDLEIQAYFRKRFRSVSPVIRAVYSYDYAPIRHLRGKTRYLNRVPGEVLVIVVERQNRRDEYVGEGGFRHIEDAGIRELKWRIRERFNPRKDGELTHEHVVHAADNPFQTHQLLRWLGIDGGAQQLLRKTHLSLPVPWYLQFTQVMFETIDLAHCRGANLSGGRWKPETRLLTIANTVQSRYLNGDKAAYESYLQTYRGTGLTDAYSVERFARLASLPPKELQLILRSHPIVVTAIDGAYVTYRILDGLHRAAISLFGRETKIPAAIVRR